jgi:hypothetical protein
MIKMMRMVNMMIIRINRINRFNNNNNQKHNLLKEEDKFMKMEEKVSLDVMNRTNNILMMKKRFKNM